MWLLEEIRTVREDVSNLRLSFMIVLNDSEMTGIPFEAGLEWRSRCCTRMFWSHCNRRPHWYDPTGTAWTEVRSWPRKTWREKWPAPQSPPSIWRSKAAARSGCSLLQVPPEGRRQPSAPPSLRAHRVGWSSPRPTRPCQQTNKPDPLSVCTQNRTGEYSGICRFQCSCCNYHVPDKLAVC